LRVHNGVSDAIGGLGRVGAFALGSGAAMLPPGARAERGAGVPVPVGGHQWHGVLDDPVERDVLWLPTA
jgi:hypothetical protein